MFPWFYLFCLFALMCWNSCCNDVCHILYSCWHMALYLNCSWFLLSHLAVKMKVQTYVTRLNEWLTDWLECKGLWYSCHDSMKWSCFSRLIPYFLVQLIQLSTHWRADWKHAHVLWALTGTDISIIKEIGCEHHKYERGFWSNTPPQVSPPCHCFCCIYLENKRKEK